MAASPDATQQHATLAPRFANYYEYFCHVLPSFDDRKSYSLLDEYLSGHAQNQGPTERDDLWLVRLYSNGQATQSYRYRHKEPALGQMPTDYIDVTSYDELRTLVGGFDETVEYQIVLLEVGYRNIPAIWAIDALGLELDMEPGVWEYICSPERKFSDFLPHSWVNRTNILSVGDNVMVVLEAVPQHRPRTAIIFIKKDPRYASQFDRPLARLPNMYPIDPPSVARKQTRDGRLQPFPNENERMFALRYWILNKSTTAEKYGPGNFFFACIEALLREHLAIVPRGITINFEPRSGIIQPMSHSLWEWELVFSSDPRALWYVLRNQVDNGRMTLRQLSALLEDNFDFKQHSLQIHLQAIRSVFERYLEEWETAESRLRTQIDDISSRKTTEMAERSIAESKRVILLTAFAFIFLPLSLAASIYGMNVQQINGSGHSITAFVVTAIALLASTLFSWGSVSLFVAYRNHRITVRVRRRQFKMALSGHNSVRTREKLIDRLFFISN